MKAESKQPNEERLKKAIEYLKPMGFIQVEGWRFNRNDIVYDLSAANLDCIDKIIELNLFVVEDLDVDDLSKDIENLENLIKTIKTVANIIKSENDKLLIEKSIWTAHNELSEVLKKVLFLK